MSPRAGGQLVSPQGPASPVHPAGAPAETRAQVVVILKDGSEGRSYAVGPAQTDIGSREGDIVIADDTYLSPRHGRIEHRSGRFALRDLGSLNGVYLRIRQPVTLADGDMILVGQQVLRFEMLLEAEQQLGPAVQHGVMVFGTPDIPRMARLVQYTNEGVGRDVFHLYREHTILGREQADIVFSDDPYMSRRHASLGIDGAQHRFVLRDLTSSNGTFVRLRHEHALEQGDQFRLGRHLFRFDLLDGREAVGAGGAGIGRDGVEQGGHVLQ